jgi:hypothetical protein
MNCSHFILGFVAVSCSVLLHLNVNGSGFTNDPEEIKEIEQRAALMDKSMRQITIREANLFHKRFVETCMDHLPRNVSLHYHGELATDDGRRKQRIITDEVIALNWQVEDTVGLFCFWISTMPTKKTAAKCSIENRYNFVKVYFLMENKSVDEKLPRLGNQSVREILAHLEKGRAEN